MWGFQTSKWSVGGQRTALCSGSQMAESGHSPAGIQLCCSWSELGQLSCHSVGCAGLRLWGCKFCAGLQVRHVAWLFPGCAAFCPFMLPDNQSYFWVEDAFSLNRQLPRMNTQQILSLSLTFSMSHSFPTGKVISTSCWFVTFAFPCSLLSAQESPIALLHRNLYCKKAEITFLSGIRWAALPVCFLYSFSAAI